MSVRDKALVALTPAVREMVLPSRHLARLEELVDIQHTHGAPWADVGAHRETRILITGWDTPSVTNEALDALPALKLIVHTAGSIRVLLSPEVWRRGILVSSAAAVNNTFVADYAYAQIILALKGVHHTGARGERTFARMPLAPGTRGQTIGLVAFGSVARLLRERLRGLDADVVAWDPFVSDEELTRAGVRRAGTLHELVEQSLVVSLHAPLIPGATEGLIDEDVLRRLLPRATLLNTARGGLVDEEAIVQVLQDRHDVFAILDVTRDEPPRPESPLWSLPNVQLTGHVAGAVGTERAELGGAAIAEIERYLSGLPVSRFVTAEEAFTRA